MLVVRRDLKNDTARREITRMVDPERGPTHRVAGAPCASRDSVEAGTACAEENPDRIDQSLQSRSSKRRCLGTSANK